MNACSTPAPRACIIAATSSGSGKTTVSLGIMRALLRRGLAVRPFKTGPDYLDGTFHETAAGVPSYNLDTWMIGRETLVNHFRARMKGGDIGIVEGAMGLYDGFEGTIEGSTADLARTLGLPVLLVADCKGMSGSIAPLMQGFMNFRSDVTITGVILNRTGSERHVGYLREALEPLGIPVVGHLPRDENIVLPHRHLGLYSASYGGITEEKIDAIADVVEKCIDLDLLQRLCSPVAPPAGRVNHHGQRPWPGLTGEARKGRKNALRSKVPTCPTAPGRGPCATNPAGITHVPILRQVMERLPVIVSRQCRIAVARDAAFHFYYRANLDLLENAGAKLVVFSPLSDRALPGDIDGLLLGGGYPEEHAETLCANESMRRSIRDFSIANGCIYAECGGFMYLGDHLEKDGIRYPMCGVFTVGFKMNDRKLKSLGYREITTMVDTLLGRAGAVMRGHEFHYSVQIDDHPAAGATPFCVTGRTPGDFLPAGIKVRNTLGSYLHIHFLSNPALSDFFVASCMREAKECLRLR